jgi:site-specific recombinase XerD
VDSGRCPRHTRETVAAISAFHEANQELALNTRRSHKNALRFLSDFLIAKGIVTIDQVDLERLNAFRAVRDVSPRTWVKELEIIRQFFRFCSDNEWIDRNPAAKVQKPRNLKPAAREPYEPNEVAKILAACDGIGSQPYERLRARAMVLTLRHTALRISDVALLERDRVRNGEIFLRTAKNGKPVKLPMHPDLQAALDMVPAPRAATGDCKYFFWSGNGTTRAMIRDATRTVSAVYAASGVQGACSHRFRHTMATEILELGGTFEEAADILGDSVKIVEMHYAKWSRLRQARITDLLARLWHTKTPSGQDAETIGRNLVDGVGLEPTTPALRTRCSPN